MSQDRSTAPGFTSWLVEGDEVALGRARRLRRKALLLSVSIQVVLVAAMLLAPLVATSERPRLRAYLPLPPYRGSLQDLPEQARTGTTQFGGPQRGPFIRQPIFEPPTIPERIGLSGNSTEAAPEIGAQALGGCAGCVPGGTDPLGQLRPDRLTQPPVPAPTLMQERARVSEGVQVALLVHRVQPVYPTLALQARTEGVVRLRAIIGRDGSVWELELMDGNPILAKAALEAVAQWRYRPTLLNGQPVEVETRITVVFELRR